MTDQNQELMLNPNNPTERAIMLQERSFSLQQRKAKALSASNIIPTTYQNNVPNCIIAMEMAQRLNTGDLEIMQNLHVIHGRPSFSSTYLIARINGSGVIKGRLKFNMEGEPGTDGYGCRCTAVCAETGDTLEGTLITLGMAASEGWSTKNGSKWKTMPEQMLKYRAAAFFSRINTPDATMGFQTTDETRDSVEKPVAGETVYVGDVGAMLEASPPVTVTLPPASEGGSVLIDSPAIVETQGTDQIISPPESSGVPLQQETENPAPAPEVWPQIVNGKFIDSAGAEFDHNEHGKSGNQPAMNADGTFRKKRGTGAKAAPAATTAASGNSEAYDTILGRINFARSSEELERVDSMEQWGQLDQSRGEATILRNIIEEKRPTLTAA